MLWGLWLTLQHLLVWQHAPAKDRSIKEYSIAGLIQKPPFNMNTKRFEINILYVVKYMISLWPKSYWRTHHPLNRSLNFDRIQSVPCTLYPPGTVVEYVQQRKRSVCEDPSFAADCWLFLCDDQVGGFECDHSYLNSIFHAPTLFSFDVLLEYFYFRSFRKPLSRWAPWTGDLDEEYS